MKRLVVALILLCALALTAGCGEADLSAYEDAEITVIGLTDEELTVTVSELAALESVSQQVEATTQKASDAKVTGPLLATFMAQYGKAPSDYFMVRVTAADGFSKKFKGSDCETAILALTRDGEGLNDDYLPLYFVIPEQSSGDWVRMATTLEFVEE